MIDWRGEGVGGRKLLLCFKCSSVLLLGLAGWSSQLNSSVCPVDFLMTWEEHSLGWFVLASQWENVFPVLCEIKLVENTNICKVYSY